MQSAADGLGLTIGEVFMPQLRGLTQAGTGILGFMDELIQAHPVLTKMIMGTAGAIGAATAAIVAYNGAKKLMAAVDLATLFTGPVGPILAVSGAVGLVATAVMGVVEAANEGVPKVDELTREAQEAAGAMEQVSADFEASRVNIAATAEVAGMYITRLDELGAKTSLTKEESQEYHNILQLLCDSVPELAGYIDLETDSIEGGTEALRAQTEAWKKNAEEQARQQAYQNLMSEYNDVLVEQAENSLRLTEAENRLRAAEEKREAILKEMDEMARQPNYDAQKYYDLGQQVYALSDDINRGKKQVDAYRQAVDKSTASADEAKAAAQGYADAMGDLSGDAEDAADKVGQVADITPQLEEAMSAAADRARELQEAYQQAYDAALTSVQGQYSLWEETAEVVAVNADTINERISSQIAYWQDYNSNLAALRERSGDIEGLGDVIASFADGSADSVNAVAGMASATDEELATMVASWQDLQAEQDEAAENISQMKTHFTEEMDDLQRELEADIAAMDLGPEAYQKGRATIQGFINGAADMEGQVWAIYNRIAGIASRALAAASTVSSIGAGIAAIAQLNGYATGTESAAPGFALVGEEGPELVFFRGGEQVLNARETAALQAQPAVSALPSAGYGGQPLVVQIYFQIEGGATPRTVEQLYEFGDEFEARVRRVMDDYAADGARRRY